MKPSVGISKATEKLCACLKLYLPALGAAQVLQLKSASLQAHCSHQLSLYCSQVIAIAAVLACPLVCLHVQGL